MTLVTERPAAVAEEFWCCESQDCDYCQGPETD